MDATSPAARHGGVAERLNRECLCVTLDRAALDRALSHEIGEALVARLSEARPHLFSNAPVFISEAEMAEMLRVVRAIEAASMLPAYREAVMAWAPEIARHDFGPHGAFMGYDFHLEAGAPRLIEVNSNAGGAFLNDVLAKAQLACCAEVDVARAKANADAFDARVLAMFRHEWMSQRGSGAPSSIAIADDDPEGQYLFPEFLLAKRLFERAGIASLIADARRFSYAGGRLSYEGRPIDLVYNRVVDFDLDEPEHAALRAAYEDGAVVVTPNPHVHALYADKRNLTLLSDAGALRSFGLDTSLIADLASVPRTRVVTPGDAGELWKGRKHLFFKPFGGHGGKAVYRGDKLTKRVFEEIAGGGYVAQDFAAPGERAVKLDDKVERRKTDVRLYTYDGEILIAAARLYQGQLTNFRTPGGGFAPVFAI